MQALDEAFCCRRPSYIERSRCVVYCHVAGLPGNGICAGAGDRAGLASRALHGRETQTLPDGAHAAAADVVGRRPWPRKPWAMSACVKRGRATTWRSWRRGVSPACGPPPQRLRHLLLRLYAVRLLRGKRPGQPGHRSRTWTSQETLDGQARGDTNGGRAKKAARHEH
jgi:hypothetical protein